MHIIQVHRTGLALLLRVHKHSPAWGGGGGQWIMSHLLSSSNLTHNYSNSKVNNDRKFEEIMIACIDRLNCHLKPHVRINHLNGLFSHIKRPTLMNSTLHSTGY